MFDEHQPPTGTILRIVEGHQTVASGALRRGAGNSGEIMYLWTAAAHRRRGHARRILSALEDAARQYGYRSVRLVTGMYQAEAIALCLAAGYDPLDDSGSRVSFAKRLA
jgi:polar amino acid transport system permease protein